MDSKGFKKATTILTTNEILLFFGNFAAAVSRVETFFCLCCWRKENFSKPHIKNDQSLAPWIQPKAKEVKLEQSTLFARESCLLQKCLRVVYTMKRVVWMSCENVIYNQ